MRDTQAPGIWHRFHAKSNVTSLRMATLFHAVSCPDIEPKHSTLVSGLAFGYGPAWYGFHVLTDHAKGLLR